MARGSCGGSPEPYDTYNIFGSRPATPFLSATTDHGVSEMQRVASLNQRTNTFWAAQLMPRERQHVCA
jgi:hypothetical protein